MVTAAVDADGMAVETVGTDAAADSASEAVAPYPELDPAVCAPSAPLELFGYDPSYQALQSQQGGTWRFVQDKNWYLLTVLQQVPVVRQALAASPVLAGLAQKREVALRQAAAKCATDPACLTAQVAWTPDEITATAAEVATVLAPTQVVGKHLRPSGRFALLAKLDDVALLTKATTEALTRLQSVFASFGAGQQTLAADLAAIAQDHPQSMAFFEPLLWAALAGLQHDGRDQAGRYEPLAAGENQAALARLKTIDWAAWRFSLVLSPGWGPDDLQTPLSANGKDHCDIAAARFKAGLAPFILLSGGHVHPDKTPYAEALEMKKYLMQQHAIPENALIVEPHARHTTTNMRNAARLMLAYGIPPDKPALIATDVAQAFYILHLDTRCKEELGYVPYRTVQSLSAEDDCFLPAAESLAADARDERDP